MGVEADRALVLVVGQQLGREERFLQVVAAEAQVLVEAQRLLAVEVDVEQLAGVEGLGELVIRIQAGHLDVGRLRVDADHLRDGRAWR